MWILLIIACSVLNNAIALEYDCLPGWTPYKRDGTCLKVFGGTYNKVPYSEASFICKVYHGHLVQIEDNEKNNDTLELLLSSKPPEKMTWLARPRSEAHDVFYDYDSKKFIPSKDYLGNVDETRCRAMKYTSGTPSWGMYHCGNWKPFVCERPGFDCPKGWTHFMGDKSCIKVENDQKLSWYDAQSVCQQEDGDLFLPIEGDKANFVIELQKKNTHYWIGFADMDIDGQFHLVNGENMDKTLPWQRREPNNAHGNEHCGEMKDGLLYDKRCGKKRNFVCELFVGSP